LKIIIKTKNKKHCKRPRRAAINNLTIIIYNYNSEFIQKRQAAETCPLFSLPNTIAAARANTLFRGVAVRRTAAITFVTAVKQLEL
jgi:hypothetical protein